MIKTINNKIVYSTKDIADILNVKKYKLKNLIKECGVIPFTKFNRTNYFDSETLIPIIEYWMIKISFKSIKERLGSND